jgi:2-dehydro-3-deoxyphosphooctonate aldolase (KDO 8-P synthase)
MKTDFFIGPCSLESQTLAEEVAGQLVEDLKGFDSEIRLTFKGSFDKANRSSIDSYRGPGIEKGLKILEHIKKTFGLELVTDFHVPTQADEVASVVDVLQIPAFLCRQTDMIVAGAMACAKHGARLKVKKGQFIAPEQTENIVTKAANFLPKDRILLTERGTMFGYGNMLVDMASFQIMKSFGVQTIHDCTHSVQMPGGLGKSTDGKREQILVLAYAAAAAGADGFFIEAHTNPEKALSDATSQLHVSQIKPLVKKLLEIKKVVQL